MRKFQTAARSPFSLKVFQLLFLSLTSACGSSTADRLTSQPGLVPNSPSAAYQEIQIPTPSGESAQARVWTDSRETPTSSKGILFVSGVDGGFIQPVDGIYERTARYFLAEFGVSSIFVQYRSPGHLERSVEDALAGAAWLQSQGAQSFVIAGWSFGGAVAIQTSTRLPGTLGTIGFAAQSLDTEPVSLFRPSQALILFHSVQDENVPYYAADQILAEVPTGVPAELFTLEQGNHALDGLSERIDPKVRDWIRARFLLH